jgi:hypothetical protein
VSEKRRLGIRIWRNWLRKHWRVIWVLDGFDTVLRLSKNERRETVVDRFKYI